MTMPFRVEPLRQLEGRLPGDLIAATLVVREGDAYLTDMRKIGFAEISAASSAPPASSGFEQLAPGQPVPDLALIDQRGRPFTLASERGKAVAITFIYTRCPLPTFCPMMDRHFGSIQRAAVNDPSMQDRVRLLSITFDPTYDTPEVLSRHARQVGADPSIWTFLTGDRDEIDRFLSRFGGTVNRNPRDPIDIVHNLRTAVIDPKGRLVKIYTGADWSPDRVVEDLKAALKAS
jgi:protein SCO1/2